jgi:hypothetical protein
VPDKGYRRLARPRRPRRRGFLTYLATRSSLWLGQDHLLNIDSTGYSEDFRRFFFRDIQSITIRTTQRRSFWNLGLGILLALCLAELTFGSSAAFDPWGIFILALSAFFAVLVIVNNALGQTCTVLIQTAVQVEEIPSLSRVPRAQRILGLIQPLIATSQGRLTPEGVVARIREANAIPEARAATAPGRLQTGPLNL